MMDLLDIPFGNRFVGWWWNGSDNTKCGSQKPVSTYDEIKEFILEHNGTDNIGISICTYLNGLPYLLVLPFDFDTDETNLEKAWNDASLFYNLVVDKGYETCLVFSGRKGFHVYIKTVPKVYPKKLIKLTQGMFRDFYNLETMDTQIFGDVRRLMRLVYTYNTNGNLCKIIASSEGKPLDLEQLIRPELVTIEKIEDEDIMPISSTYNGDYPCVDRLICDKEYWKKHHPRKQYEPAQPIRYSWVLIRKNKGKSEEEIFKEGKSYKWDDFNEDKTKYQIHHIYIDPKYKPHSCDTLRTMGYCVIDDCPKKGVDICYLRKIGLVK